jgi:hypothetical protein
MAEETASLSSLGAEFASAAAPDTAKADHGHFYSLLMQVLCGHWLISFNVLRCVLIGSWGSCSLLIE